VPTPVEVAPSAPEAPIEPAIEVSSPEHITTIDLTHEQDLAAQKLAEAAQTNVAEQAHSIVNSFGIEVPVTEPHTYADAAKHVFVYGGSPVEQAKSIGEYLTKNPEGTIFGTDNDGKYRIPWQLVNGELVPGRPVRTSGFFGFFSSFMAAPTPEEFESIIK
jgi:hypothetical protein